MLLKSSTTNNDRLSTTAPNGRETVDVNGPSPRSLDAEKGDGRRADIKDSSPAHPGSAETASALIVHPSDALAEFQQRKITFMPPQFYIMDTLARILQGRTNTAEQRAGIRRAEQLRRGATGRCSYGQGMGLKRQSVGQAVMGHNG